MTVADDFAELFAGRTDAIGDGERGRCIREPFGGIEEAIEAHLNGAYSLGIYPMVARVKDSFSHPHYIVKWGCVDIDVRADNHPAFDAETEDDAHAMALNLHRTLAAFGIRAWIERTRSCGRHVWVFAEAWVPAATMRRALLAATKIAGVSNREVNPKQETLVDGPCPSCKGKGEREYGGQRGALDPCVKCDGTGRTSSLGNYVNLPYFGGEGVGTPTTRLMLAVGPGPWQGYIPYPLRVFVEQALASRCTEAQLDRVAKLWKPPEITKDLFRPYTPLDDGWRYATLNAAGRAVLENGPQDGDRSRGLAYLAWQCFRSGFDPQQALDTVDAADQAWGKFVGRRDRDKRLREIVERAYP